MLSRALSLAAVALLIGYFAVAPAEAQNLEAGKSSSQIFSSTCSLCHKSSRGLLKTIAPGSLPGFLRQHYTTSSDMAAMLSAYVLSNGAANARTGGDDNLTREGKESRSAPKPAAAPEPEQESKRGRRSREASKPDADGIEDKPDAPPHGRTAREDAKQKAAKSKHDKGKSKAATAKDEPKTEPKIEAKPETPADNAAKVEPSDATVKDDAAKASNDKAGTDKPEASEPEVGEPDATKPDAPKGEIVTRPDPVPAVTPAPSGSEPVPVPEAPQKAAEDKPSGMPVFVKPAPEAAAAPPPAPTPGEPPRAPAGPPIPPISQ